jgi:hypothetical protein
MALPPRKTYPELTALTAPVVDSDVVAVYRSPGPLRRTTVSTLLNGAAKTDGSNITGGNPALFRAAIGLGPTDAVAFGTGVFKGTNTLQFQIQQADGTQLLNVDTTTPRASIAGTRTSAGPRLSGGTATDLNFDAFIVSNCVARGTTLFRDEFQSTCDFQSLNGAHAAFDAFDQFGGSQAMNHARGFQARMKVNMTGGVQLSEWTGNVVLPIFNGTFNIGELQGFWFRDAQIDSGTQNVFQSYALRIDNCPNLGANFIPILSFSDKNSYLGGGLQLANTADLYGAREVRANAVHANGSISTYAAGGGVVASYSGGIGFVRSYSDGSGTADILAINPVGGRVIVGDSVGANGGAALDVVGVTCSTTYFVGANQVVGARGAAVADATDAASVIARFNELLSRLRTHGLIAT